MPWWRMWRRCQFSLLHTKWFGVFVVNAFTSRNLGNVACVHTVQSNWKCFDGKLPTLFRFNGVFSRFGCSIEYQTHTKTPQDVNRCTVNNKRVQRMSSIPTFPSHPSRIHSIICILGSLFRNRVLLVNQQSRCMEGARNQNKYCVMCHYH